MPLHAHQLRRDPRVPDVDDDGTFGLGGPGAEVAQQEGEVTNASTWTRLDGVVPGAVVYPHGFSVRYRLELPLPARLEALTRIGWMEGETVEWRRVGRRHVIRGSVYLTQRAPRTRGRARRSVLARFNSARHTAFYSIGIQHTPETTHIELNGVRWSDVEKFFEEILRVGMGAAKIDYFLNLERYVVLTPDQAFGVAKRLGFVEGAGRAAYRRKRYLIEKVEIPVRIRSRATSKVVISMYRIDLGATSDFKLEARLRGRRRDGTHFREADCQLLDNILLAFLEDHGLQSILKPARWEPRDRRGRSDSSPVAPDIRALPNKAWRGPAMRQDLVRRFSDLHIPPTPAPHSRARNLDASDGLAGIIRTPSAESPLWPLVQPADLLDVRWYKPLETTPMTSTRGPRPSVAKVPYEHDAHGALAREIAAVGSGVVEVILPHETSPAAFIEAILNVRRDRRVGIDYLGGESWYAVEVLRDLHPLEPDTEDVVLVVDPSVVASQVGPPDSDMLRGAFARAVAYKANRDATGLAYDPEVLSTAAMMWGFLEAARGTCERTGSLMVLFTVDHRTQAGVDGTAGNARYSDSLVRSFIGDAGRYWCHQRYRVEAKRDDVREVVTLRDDAEGLVGRLVWPGGRP